MTSKELRDYTKLLAEISVIHEFIWTDAMNYKHGLSKYDKLDTVNSADRQVKAKIDEIINTILDYVDKEVIGSEEPLSIDDRDFDWINYRNNLRGEQRTLIAKLRQP